MLRKISTINRKSVATVISVVMLFCFTGTAMADQFDDQISALKSQATAQQQQAAAFSAQATDYQQKVAQLQSQISQLQTQISLNQVLYNQVTQNISDNEAKLAQEKTILAANIQAMYLASTVTPLEMLASSQNFSDFFNQQQYQDKIKDKIQSSMSQVQLIQTQLVSQRDQVSQLIASQQGQQQQLSATQNQVNQLLATAQQNAAAANAQITQDNAKVSSLQQQQAAAIAAASRKVNFSGVPGSSGGSGGACDNGSGNGGYPAVWCNAGQDSEVDSWGMYNRECVSYAAWAASVNGHYVPYGLGNANQWPAAAQARGITVNSTPEVGNVAIYMGGPYGHDMIVQQINGSTVTVSSMNADDHGHFEYDVWSISSLVFIHFH